MYEEAQQQPMHWRIVRDTSRLAWLHKPAIAILLFCDMLFSSRLYWAVPSPLIQPILLGISAALIVFYAGIAYLRGAMFPLILLIVTAGLFWNQMQVFSWMTKIEVQTNTFFQFVWILTFIVFFCAAKDGHRDYVVSVLFKYATIYIAIYAVMAVLSKVNALPGGLLKAITLTDIERGDRLFMYSPAATFAWFGWLQRAGRQFNIKTAIMLILCMIAISAALSRVLIVLMLILTLVHFARLSLLSARRLSLVIFFSVSAVNLYGLYDPTWNPYSPFAGDSSGSYRVMEYTLAQHFIWQDPIFGFGLAPSTKTAGLVLNNDFFSGSDVGATGVWFNYGLTGLIMFLIGSRIACQPVVINDSDLGKSISLTGCLLAAYGCLAPVILAGGATYFAVIVGLWLGARQKKKRAALPWSDGGRSGQVARPLPLGQVIAE